MNCRRVAAPLVFLLILLWLPSASAERRRSDSRRARSPVNAGSRRVDRSEPLRRAMTSERLRSERSSASETPEGRLTAELHDIWAGRILRRGVTAVYVVDARTGKGIYAVHADDKLNPASNVKLMSTATVLDVMGPEWRYLTRLFGPAPDREGVAHGSVYLRGNADPTLTSASLDDLAGAVARTGVKRIEGDVLLSDDLLRETIESPGIRIRVQAGEHTGAPPLVSTDLADSFVQLQVTAVTTSSRRARLTITAEPVAMPAEAQAGAQPASAATGSAALDGPRVLVRVGGTIRKGASGTYYRNPGMRSTFTGYAMRHALATAGVQVTGGVRLAEFDAYTQEAMAAGFLPIELGRYRSRSMRELVARVNKRSLNFMADRLLMTAGAEAAGGGPPSLERGIEAMYRWLEQSGLDRKEIVLDTGSGLSRRTKLTVRHLVSALRAAAGYASQLSPPGLLDPAIFRASLAVGGVDGTLRGRFRGDELRGRVVGKTGTLHDSIALSGFVSDDGGNALCFSIVTNGNRWAARGPIRREHEQMVAAMKRYLDSRAARDGEDRGIAQAAEPGQTGLEPAKTAQVAGSVTAAAVAASDGEGQSGDAAEDDGVEVPAESDEGASNQGGDTDGDTAGEASDAAGEARDAAE